MGNKSFVRQFDPQGCSPTTASLEISVLFKLSPLPSGKADLKKSASPTGWKGAAPS